MKVVPYFYCWRGNPLWSTLNYWSDRGGKVIGWIDWLTLAEYLTENQGRIRNRWFVKIKDLTPISVYDVPGLVTEEATMEGLIEKLKVIIPELLEANGVQIDQEVPFEIMTRRFEIAQSAGI